MADVELNINTNIDEIQKEFDELTKDFTKAKQYFSAYSHVQSLALRRLSNNTMKSYKDLEDAVVNIGKTIRENMSGDSYSLTSEQIKDIVEEYNYLLNIMKKSNMAYYLYHQFNGVNNEIRNMLESLKIKAKAIGFDYSSLHSLASGMDYPMEERDPLFQMLNTKALELRELEDQLAKQAADIDTKGLDKLETSLNDVSDALDETIDKVDDLSDSLDGVDKAATDMSLDKTVDNLDELADSIGAVDNAATSISLDDLLEGSDEQLLKILNMVNELNNAQKSKSKTKDVYAEQVEKLLDLRDEFMRQIKL